MPIGKLGDDRFAVQLVGKTLNTSDELSDRAVRSDTFKKVVTGELMSARDVYKSAVTFRPTALHLFSTNRLPSFKGGIDGGVARRLLAFEFSHVVPEEQVIPDLDERIARDEADLLLELAVEGARRILKNGLFTVPASSAELMREWLAEVDPVRGWAGERLEVTRVEERDHGVRAVRRLRAVGRAAGLRSRPLAQPQRLRPAADGGRAGPEEAAQQRHRLHERALEDRRHELVVGSAFFRSR